MASNLRHASHSQCINSEPLSLHAPQKITFSYWWWQESNKRHISVDKNDESCDPGPTIWAMSAGLAEHSWTLSYRPVFDAVCSSIIYAATQIDSIAVLNAQINCGSMLHAIEVSPVSLNSLWRKHHAQPELYVCYSKILANLRSHLYCFK